jgi:hypothetical protein
VWPAVIVIVPPLAQRRSNIVERNKFVGVQTLIPQPSIERLDHPVLDRLPRSDAVEPDTGPVTTLVEYFRREFCSVIVARGNRQGRATISSRRKNLNRASALAYL